MSSRTQRLLWGLFLALVTAVLVLAYKRFVLDVPGGIYKWTRNGVIYELLEPRTLAIVLLAPLLLFVIGRSGSSHSVPGVELPAVSSTHVRALFSQPGAAARAELELLVPRRALDYARAERLYAHSSSPDGSPLNGP